MGLNKNNNGGSSNTITEIPSEYITEVELDEKGYVTKDELDNNLLNVADNINEFKEFILPIEENILENLPENINYPYNFVLNSDGILNVQLQGNTKILNSNGEEVESGEADAVLTSVNNCKITVNDEENQLAYYNDEGELITITDLCRHSDSLYNAIEMHDDGKYYYHERCVQVKLEPDVVYAQSDNNQIEGYFTGYIASAYLPILASVYNSQCLCDKLVGASSWSDVKTSPSEFIGVHANSSLNIRVSNDKATDTDSLKQWINDNNVNVIFQLVEEKVYECILLDYNVNEGENELNIDCELVKPFVSLSIRNGIDAKFDMIKNKNTSNNEKINDMNENLSLLNSLNVIYSKNNKTLLLSSLVEETDISDVVNTALMIDDVERVVLPLGIYNVSRTIEIPAKKRLVLQGSYKDDIKSDFIQNKNKNTILNLTTSGISMIKMKKESCLEGGYLNLGTNIDCQAIRLDFWEENHTETKVVGTRINGSSARNLNQIGVLMECDPDDGISKNGYGVYCDFDIAINTVSIAYHLHRHNATWNDGPSDIVWVTECYFRGFINHCNRYIWFDTIGGWGGDSSIIEATIQGGSIVGEDTPGIELNCNAVRIIGNLWDFGGEGLQQHSVKLGGRSKNTLILGETTRNYIEDNGVNNVVFSDLVKENQNVGESTCNNSFMGNEDKFDITITVNYLDGSQEIINDFTSLPYNPFDGYHINGIRFIERFFRPVNKNKFVLIDMTIIDNVEIRASFSSLARLRNVGINIGEMYIPENVSIHATKQIDTSLTEFTLFEKNFNDFDNTNTSNGYHSYIQNIDKWYNSNPNSNSLYSKSNCVSEVKWVINGSILTQNNNIHIGELLLDITGVNPNHNYRYIIDEENLDVLSSINYKSVFGEKIKEIDFSNFDEENTSIEDIFVVDNNLFFNNGGMVDIIDGQLHVLPNNAIGDACTLSLKDVDNNNIVLYDIETNFNNMNKVYYLGGQLGVYIKKGRLLLMGASVDVPIISSFRSSLEEGEYVRVNRITIYNKPTKNIFYPEIDDNLKRAYRI